LKLKRDEPLSNFAFNLNLRRYIAAEAKSLAAHAKMDDDTSVARIAQLTKQLNYLKTEQQRLKDLAEKADLFHADKESAAKVGRCRLTVSKPELKARLVSEYSLETQI
jgi:hypothetical protein